MSWVYFRRYEYHKCSILYIQCLRSCKARWVGGPRQSRFNQLSDSELLNSQSLDFRLQFLREIRAVMKESWSFEVIASPDSDSKGSRVNKARSSVINGKWKPFLFFITFVFRLLTWTFINQPTALKWQPQFPGLGVLGLGTGLKSQSLNWPINPKS